MIPISYLIGTKNEGVHYLEPLLSRLIKYKQPEDEIIVLDDYSDDQSTLDTLEKHKEHISVHKHALNGDFATHKNYGNSLAKGKFIVNLDGDEIVSETILQVIKEILLNNESIDVFLVPRINIVKGLTQEDIDKWHWHVNDKGHINFPDLQSRIYRNDHNIRWINKVHEKIIGMKSFSTLPYEDDQYSYCILHLKEIDRQRKQNELYETIK